MAGVSEWVEANSDRVANRQRARSDTMKLAATLVIGVVATLVATGLQVGAEPIWQDRAASYLLAASVCATLLIFLVDRMQEVDHDAVLGYAFMQSWNEVDTVKELRRQLVAVIRDNDKVLESMRFALGIQLALSTLTGLIATLGLLRTA